MDMGRESRWEKDAMTVEIVFALVSAALLGAAVFAVSFGAVLVFDVTGPARDRTLTGGALLGAAAGVWRVVRVLRRFDAERRKGH
ncbi:hypothetical protein AMK18_30460 [Streptomyces sp. CB01249]|uniref:DUF6332 family protein n=1 Tax=Streptomyces sp. CB01249 TaxID=1703929 RepID=UPI00093AF08C|nr:DUF6332 family protein [Streptomyces sp. CB01249]OKI93122.1 hypothetical protein AMK18_30460 [Streptomyces sp. CB01249]